MKVIICGASEVGSNIAKQLVYEDNDVTGRAISGPHVVYP